MEALKIDRTKLCTVKNYAKIMGITPQQVYNWAKYKKIKMIEIDGVKFIQL
jgi:hypothetical protein